ncbi:hypothetical protein [Calothrix sp. PCC 6303]|nr:hypothetical protein [Calothrix sp. PCC 6303]AFZ03801.1 hypothetical protein Cal6303_4903 [Calothrix sp. PCC 6303]
MQFGGMIMGETGKNLGKAVGIIVDETTPVGKVVNIIARIFFPWW